MQRQVFGRRVTLSPPEPVHPGRPLPAAVQAAPAISPHTDQSTAAPAALAEEDIRAAAHADDPVDHEIDHWNAVRKAKKRSFREPWRSCAIATSLMFGVSSWLLPDSVSNVAQLITLLLTGASIWAGYRQKAAG